MKSEHSIDRLFRQGLKDYKDKAPDYSWSVISAELQHRKRVRYLRITKYAAAVVALLAAFYFGYEFSESNFSDNGMMVQQTENSSAGSSEKQASLSEDPVSLLEYFDLQELTNDVTDVAIDRRNTLTGNFSVQLAERRSSLASLESFGFGLINEQAHKITSLPDNYSEKLLNYSESGMLVLNGKDDQQKASKQEKSRWVVGGVYTPTYAYRTTNTDKLGIFNNTIQSDNSEPNSHEEALITYSGGINAQYLINDNWQLETGIYYSRLGQKKNAVSVKYNDLIGEGKKYHLNTSAGKVDGSKVPKAITEEIRGEFSPINGSKDYYTNTSIDFRLYQKFDYLEIPLIVKYKVYDRKLAINLVSGLNTGVLVNNETRISTEEDKLNLGQTENLREILHSTIAGVGVQIPLTNHFMLNFEPTFKYALHSINTSKEFGYRPYSFGVYSGVKFRF